MGLGCLSDLPPASLVPLKAHPYGQKPRVSTSVSWGRPEAQRDTDQQHATRTCFRDTSDYTGISAPLGEPWCHLSERHSKE